MRLTDEQVEGIADHIGKGNIRVQTHPEYPLRILNYTPEAQYSGAWDEFTLMSRGLIVDPDNTIIARPFPKFFNWGEWERSDQIKYGQRDDYTVTEKMDGSLGIGYWWDGKFHLATRGSFMSEQAQRANADLVPRFDFFDFPEDTTPLFEIVAPWNRIVIPYAQEDLVLLDVLRNESGMPLGWKPEEMWAGSVVPRFHGTLSQVQEYKTDALEEGFVVTWSDGARAKFKVEEYVRLHRILTGTNSTRIWEALQDHKAWALLLDHTPDEFNQWVHKTANEISEEYASLDVRANDYFAELEPLSEVSRKEFALAATKTDIPDLLFALLDGKDIRPLLWRRVKPETSFPFMAVVD